MILAEEQLEGRGRRGRSWISRPGAGIWASIILRRGVPTETPQWIMAAGAVSVCEAARAAGVARAEIKWPNDVIAEGEKLAGIIGELIGEIRPFPAAILGIGVNVDAGVEASVLAPGVSATSLRAAGLSEDIDREEILALILVRLQIHLAGIEGGRFDALLERWRSLSPTCQGRRVTVEDAEQGRFLSGTTRGIAPDGSLIVHEDVSGAPRAVRFGGTVRFAPVGQENVDAARH